MENRTKQRDHVGSLFASARRWDSEFVEKWDPKQTALDVLRGRYDAQLNAFLNTLTDEQLKELVRALDSVKNPTKSERI